MRNVDPSGEALTSVSGACVPSHDRERLDCYFTGFELRKAQSDEDLEEVLCQHHRRVERPP
jgi:hypothetical protein